ncbi:alpha/beta fold hydrolase [Kordiimonas sp. SCSIO 12610]|uniref:alpha/beta fold hydrolase n=1 Tax=Kordiimonas sp. SCSIO 12610 TaxID=2829597 RepID=UPI00210B30FF|nr:alpha/beta fold hydrolase [Kordiimonas sp. SCSIO 12610]UTW54786.1 alpha/beta fold hydrolase [Kordiimonas sp. SCSIO 12610]
MAPTKKKIGETAAETTTAFNPIVGVHRSELIKSLGIVLKQAALNPVTFGQHFLNYSKDIVDIARGKSEYAPNAKDRRFQDRAWAFNPLYRRGMQSWMAMKSNLNNWLTEANLEEIDRARAHFILEVITDSLAPTNSLIGNPKAMKRLYETGGLSIVQGLKNAYNDMVNGIGIPSQVDSRPFKVGENLAATPGDVVFRNDVLEVIQYTPTTEKVREIPLIVIPPQINKFYASDLTPDKSLFRFMLSQGIQLFAISWRNPGPEHAHWGLETYINAAIEAMDAVMAITKSKKVNVSGACSGGITVATLLSHLAAKGDDRVNCSTFQVCVLDPRQEDSEVGALVSEETLELARARSASKGILSGDDLARTFAWMRPNDLIWNYVVNNYLLGDSPPAFDILFWNNDTTNLPAALHSDFLDSYMAAPFANPGTVEFMGEKLDLGKVTHDSFVVAGFTDHITPWRACYRTTKLLGGNTEFYVSNSGHIQSLLNPPGNPKAKYFHNQGAMDGSADEWMASAELLDGSWWTPWSEWLIAHAGKEKPTPKSNGNRKYKSLAPAPGEYVFG